MPIITNLIATITVLLSTNAVEHWPQATIGYRDKIGLGDPNKVYPIGDSIPASAEWVTINNTDADTKSVETTVTAEQRLRFNLGPSLHDKILAQDAALKFVRGNEKLSTVQSVAELTEDILNGHFPFRDKSFDLLLTNWPVAHYSVDYERVRTNVNAWFKQKEIKCENGTSYTLVADDQHARLIVTYPTNWFEPVATNRLPLWP